MPALAKPRHEAFAQAIVAGIAKGWTQHEAYRAAGYNPSNEATARACASRLLTIGNKIGARIAELQAQAAKRKQVTVATIVEELEEARGVAKDQAQGAAMVAASSAKAKVLGLSVERIEQGKPGDFTQADTSEQVANALLKQAGIELAGLELSVCEELRGRALEALRAFNNSLSELATLANAQTTASA